MVGKVEGDLNVKQKLLYAIIWIHDLDREDHAVIALTKNSPCLENVKALPPGLSQ